MVGATKNPIGQVHRGHGTKKPTQVQDEVPALGETSGHEALPLTKKLLQSIPAGKGKVRFLERSVSGCMDHTPGL